MKLYTQRKSSPHRTLIYIFQQQVRQRLLAVLEDHISKPKDNFFNDLGHALVQTYGYLQRSSFEAARTSNNPVIEHYFRCSDEQVLDFFEAAFQNRQYNGGQDGIDSLNNVLQDTGIGYRFTDYPAKESIGLFFPKKVAVNSGFPEAHRITDEHIYQTVVKPAIQFLSEAEFSISHDELLRSLSACRQNEPEDSITLACAAYESFLKTLLSIKGHSFNKDKDACSRLVKICIANDILPSFYEQCLISPATIRNKLGDAHGRGPTKTHEPLVEHSDHMINLVCSNILLLKKCAGL